MAIKSAEAKERKREWMRAYRQRPEVKEHYRAYCQQPEIKRRRCEMQRARCGSLPLKQHLALCAQAKQERLAKLARGASYKRWWKDAVPRTIDLAKQTQEEISDRLHDRLYAILSGRASNRVAIRLLGCPIQMFRHYMASRMRSGMSWENYGTVWHIDHIVPQAKFDLTDPAQRRACWHHSNLQPLLGPENMKKGCAMWAPVQMELPLVIECQPALTTIKRRVVLPCNVPDAILRTVAKEKQEWARMARLSGLRNSGKMVGRLISGRRQTWPL